MPPKFLQAKPSKPKQNQPSSQIVHELEYDCVLFTTLGKVQQMKTILYIYCHTQQTIHYITSIYFLI
jgi:hypothetical protein